MRHSLSTTLLLATAVSACGQGPSFFDESNKGGKRSAAAGLQGDADATAGTDGGEPTPSDDTTGDVEGSDTTTTDPDAMPAIPDADDKDLDALHKCLRSWKNHPFGDTVTSYKRIFASVTVGGFGNAINDTETTPEPQLVLVDAGVNVLGAPTYNLLNANGWYCMKVNVNVMTTLKVNLHCSAHLADQRVNVNVGSTQSDTTSAVGVHVLSNVQVVTVRPEGDSCIR